MKHRSRILFVDDERSVLDAFQRSFRKVFEMETAENAADALLLLRQNGPYAVLVADMQMPGMNGIELLARAKELAPDTVRLMLTGNAEQKTAMDALNRGQIFQFLSKPCDAAQLQGAVEAAIRENDRVRAERELLESTVAGSVRVLAEVLAMIEPGSFGLGQKLRDSARAFGLWMNLPSTWEIETAAVLLHLGYASVPTSILRKLDVALPLLASEQAVIDRTPQVGHDLLVKIPRLEGVARTILYAKKRFDGGGFPEDSVSGDDIPLGARLLRVLHDRALLESDGVVKARAFGEMNSRVGTYDPKLVEKCFLCFPDFLVNAIQAGSPVRTVGVSDLKVGDVLVSDVRTPSGILLVSAGNCIAETMVKRLKNYAAFHDIKVPLYVQ